MRKKSSQFDQFEKSIAINSFLTAQRCCNLDFDKKKKFYKQIHVQLYYEDEVCALFGHMG